MEKKGESSKLQVFSAELRSFWSTKTLESSSEGVSLEIKHTQVVIQKVDLGNDKKQHRIVVLNETSAEAFTYAVHEIIQLHHMEENHVKLSGTDEWDLILKDRTDVNNFVRMVEEFSKCSLQTSDTHASGSVKTDFVVPEEEKNASASLSQMASKMDPFTAPPTSSVSKSVFEKITNTSLPPPGESNNEAMSSENDVIMDDITENTVPKPSTEDNEDDDISLSPVVPSMDYRIRSSTPTNVDSSNAGLQQDILNSNTVTASTDNPPRSALVGGMAHNTGMVQNEQRNAKKAKPEKLQFDSRQDCPTPDRSMGSERSTLSRVGACILNSSRGTDDEGFRMELDDSYRHYKKMVKCYKKTLTYYWSKHSGSGRSKIHRVIAALVCQNGKSCYTAILSTGAYHNDSEKCGYTSTCDGHAVSICYEVAPKYFLQEIESLKNGEDSVFECLPNAEGYKLKDGVSFHLLVTQFPCGFIRDHKDPCMEWKVPFVEFPHVPTCSSRILIGATMGIQGYVSHLLDKPITIDSLVILCTDADQTQVLDFGTAFEMPKLIKTMKYDPENFKPGFFFPPKHSPNTSFTECESTDGNETVKSVGPGLEEAKDSAGTMATPDKDTSSIFFRYDPRTVGETSSDNEFSIKTRDIYQSFEVDEELKKQRMYHLQKLYNDLASRLKIEEALEKLSTELNAEIKKKEETMSSLLQCVSTELTEVAPHTVGTSMQEWDNYLQKQKAHLHHIGEEGKTKIRNQNMVMCIKTILSTKRENVIMDCNWHQYLYVSPSSVQPSD